MTIASGQTIDLPTSHFVGWTHLEDVRLPFPLNTREQEYAATPSATELDKYLAADRLDESPVLAVVQRALATPALVVYAVRSEGLEPDSPERKYVAVSGRAANSSALVVLDTEHTSVRAVADTELAASVASSVPTPVPPAFAAFDTTLETLSEVEQACVSEASVRTKRAAMNAAGLPPDFVAVREAMLDRPATVAGLVSAVRCAEDGSSAPAHRSAVWMESPAGAYLQIAMPPRGSRTEIRVTPLTAEHLFRAAADAIASCFESPS